MRILLILLSITLMGCSSIFVQQRFPANHPKTWPSQFYRLHKMKKWNAQGKISITRHNDTTFGSFKWAQLWHYYRLRLFPPFGSDFVEIIGKPHRATLIHKKQRVTRRNPEILMAHEIGWTMPVSSLRYWIRGLPVPHHHAKMQFNSKGALAKLRQGHWQVYYLSRFHQGQNNLPKKIVLIHPGLRIKIVITHWYLKH